MTTPPQTDILAVPFGDTTDGRPASLYTLTNHNGITAAITNFGGRLVRLHVPDARGKLDDIVLGFDSLDRYQSADDQCFGATIGRVANRIGNARFTLAGKTCQLDENRPGISLHGGGKHSFHGILFDARPAPSDRGPALELTCHSPDGQAGFPGNVTASVTYTLTHDNALRLDYTATTDQPTPINLTNHSYFNLSGPGSASVLDHIVTLHASHYLPLDHRLVPSGEIAPVDARPVDFRQPTSIGARFEQAARDSTAGYDYHMIFDKPDRRLAFAASVFDPATGRVMDMFTTELGAQFYSGNNLKNQLGKAGKPYPPQSAFCLEAQGFPDAVNHEHFPSIILQPGQVYRQTTIYRFTAVPV